MSRKATPEAQHHVQRLWQEYKLQGSESAREALIQYYRFIITKTRQRIIPDVPYRIDPHDLDQEGYIALVKAVDNFDPSRKVKFESYAISMVRGAMLEYLRREDWVPRSIRARQKMIARAEEEVARVKGWGNVRPADVADRLQLTIDAFYQLYFEANIVTVVGLQETVGDSEHEDSDAPQIQESVRSDDAPPDMWAILQNQRGLLMKCVSWLPLPERKVVLLYYYEGWTLKNIASFLGRSESRAHQLHAQAVQRLKGFLARERGLFLDGLTVEPSPDELERGLQVVAA